MVLELTFLDWKSNSGKMNAAAGASKVGFLARSFWLAWDLIIGAAKLSQKGVYLFGGEKGEEEEDDDKELIWQSLPIKNLSILWLLATSNTSENSCISFLQMKVRKGKMSDGSFQVLLKSLILLGALNLPVLNG